MHTIDLSQRERGSLAKCYSKLMSLGQHTMETAIKTIGSSSSVRARTGRCATLRARRPVPLLEYDYLTTHQPGNTPRTHSYRACCSPRAYAPPTHRSICRSGWRTACEAISPTMAAKVLSKARRTERSKNSRPGLSHFEVLDKFVRAYDAFLLRTG